jgi:hypothetical protein
MKRKKIHKQYGLGHEPFGIPEHIKKGIIKLRDVPGGLNALQEQNDEMIKLILSTSNYAPDWRENDRRTD